MSQFLFQYYPVHPTTWVYLSSLLMVGLFFKFGRFWSVRNLDLVLLILLAPGLLLVHFGNETAKREGTQSSDSTVKPKSPANSTAADRGSQATELAKSSDKAAAVAESVPPPKPASLDAAATVAATANDVASQIPRTRLSGRALQYIGFVWLLSACGLFLLRLLLDPTMVRRPLLEPNLSPGGLTFIGCSLFVFLMANVVNSQVTEENLASARGADQLLSGMPDQGAAALLKKHGPGNALLHFVPSLATVPLTWNEGGVSDANVRYVRIAKIMAILSHFAIVFGIVAIGYRHFDNIRMGLGAATLYLMMPYTSQMTGRVDHVLPSALLVWAVLCYRRPLTSGMFIGMAIGVIYYPLFLLPLWISFYWQRGLLRFLGGVAITLTASVLSLVLVSESPADFLAKVQVLFGIWVPLREGLQGIWQLGWDPNFRLPVMAGFVAISCAMAIWPAQKNLGTLLSCSAAIMVATQFWHGFGGGLYMAWFLPLVLLTIFRPNLEDRIALSVLAESWLQKRRHRAGLNGAEKAA